MDEMTVGEIGRSLLRLETSQREQNEKLDEIKEQTAKTNGFVGRHEERLNGLDREVRDLKRGGHRTTHTLARQSDRPDATTFTIPNNVLKAIGVVLGAAIAAAIAAFLGVKQP